MDKYAAWHPADLEHFYVSPGLIDVNVRGNNTWESVETRTKEAISGGVTMMLEEPSVYAMESEAGDLYCDVGGVALLESGSCTEPDPSVFALKGYLYPPSAYVGGLSSGLRGAMETASRLNLPLFLDPSYPSPRMLYLCSPLHNKPLQDRFQDLDSDETQFFASVFPDIIESSSSGSLSDAEETDVFDEGPDRTKSNIDGYHVMENPAPIVVHEEALSAKHTRDFPVRSFRLGHENSTLQRQSSVPKLHTIYDDLDKRIRKHHCNIENLSALEMESYEYTAESPEATAVRKRSQSACYAGFELVITESESSGNPSRDCSPFKGNSTDADQNLYKERLKFTRPGSLALGKTHNKPSPSATSKERNHMVYLANCPGSWEIKGIDLIAKALKKTPCRVHITNLSSAEAVNRVRQIKEFSELMTCETCPHYLFFTADQVASGDTRYKAFPPIRDRQNCDLLWESLLLKVIDVIASNHSAVAKELKFPDLGSFKKALSGVNCLGFSLMAVWTQIKQRFTDNLDRYITRMAKWLSWTPAKLIGVANLRGSIEKGKYADIVIWSPFGKGRTVTCGPAASLSPYLDAQLDGTIHRVYLRGKIAYNEGSFTAVGKKVPRSV